MRRVPFLLAAILLVACSTGRGLVDHGFRAEPAGDDAWEVSFEGESMSRERARDNLLYHSARHVLDHGGVYFTFDESETEARLDREHTSSVKNEPSLGNPSGESYGSEVSFQRVVTVSALVRMVDQPGPGVRDASKVLDDLARKYQR